jgi:superfamily II RNA helicase
MTTTQTKFELDQFQTDAIAHLKNEKSVIVCAPTGSGKTLIAKEAIREALKNNKKVFYTAPLKALINQKFNEFASEFGEDQVGILTGDTSRNRDARIMVMTTEIYRNMLYNTNFGSLDQYLSELEYVIFDEFHYLGDENRGTVWEESVIYSPESIKLIALSATVNNAKEIQDWIKKVHGSCELVKTNNRPVPLHFHYYKDSQLVPLLTPNKKLNPKLKERNDSRFSKNKNNRNHHHGKHPSPADLVEELAKKDMLPAIYFVFSRKGCDNNASQCEKLNLLSKSEKAEATKLVEQAAKDNPYIASYAKLDLLKAGIASHHSGLLPALKTLIESLFEKGLIKVVFSTETLAAGINMPARTTVISSIYKMGDGGFRSFKVSEFMQMAGRAGRRGMDDAGYVVTVKNQNQSATEAAMLASSVSEDIESNFNASYEMVLNLLTNHSLEQVKTMVLKSFGHSLVSKDIKPLADEKDKLENSLFDLQAPLCPGEIGDLQHYKGLQEKLDETRRKKKRYEKDMDPAVSEMEELLEILTLEVQNYPCNGCPKQKPCSKQMSKIKRYRKKVRDLTNTINQRELVYWHEFERIVELLKDNGYLDEDNKPTTKGKVCASIRSENSFYITEVVTSEFVKDLSALEFAAVMSAIVIETRAGRDSRTLRSHAEMYNTFEKLNSIARAVIRTQRSYRISHSAEVNLDAVPVITKWMETQDWDQLVSEVNLDDGDALKALRRTLDMCKQIAGNPALDAKLKEIANDAATVIEKEPVLEVA